MPETFFIDLIRYRDALAYPIYEYNCCPARYMHSSHRDKLIPGSIFDLLIQTEKGERYLSEYLLTLLKIDRNEVIDFKDPDQRLVFYSAEKIETMVFYAGIVWNSILIRHMIDSQGLRRLRSSIGEEAYRFALHRAPFLLSRFDAVSPPHLPEDWRQDCMEIGIRLLFTCFRDAPEPFLKRLKLKLPLWYEPFFHVADFTVEKETAQRIYRKLSRETALHGGYPVSEKRSI